MFRNGVNADRTVVQQWSCDRLVPSMQWRFSTSVRTVSSRSFPLSGHGHGGLDVAAGSLEPGAQIQIYQCTQANTNTAQIGKQGQSPRELKRAQTHRPRLGDWVGLGGGSGLIPSRASPRRAVVQPVPRRRVMFPRRQRFAAARFRCHTPGRTSGKGRLEDINQRKKEGLDGGNPITEAYRHPSGRRRPPGAGEKG